MIRIIKYNIKFPLGAFFHKDPEFLFLKKIYKEIFSCTCLNKEQKCSDCYLQSKCIYHLLSGENFTQFPAIGIIRNVSNKRTFNNKDVLHLTFFLVGVATNYADFITSFMETEEYIGDTFFQKVLEINRIFKTDDTYTGIIKYKNIVQSTSDIIECINYYNIKYNCKFSLPSFDNIKDKMEFKDYSFYNINGNVIKLNGIIFKTYVYNYPKLLFDIGVGKFNYLGGGICECESE